MPEKSQREHAYDRLMEATKNSGVGSAEAVRALIDAIWLTPKDDTLGKEEMLSNLCLLSGMATAALIDHARVLEALNR